MLDSDAERVEENEEDDEPEEQLMFHRLTNKVPDDKERQITIKYAGSFFIESTSNIV